MKKLITILLIAIGGVLFTFIPPLNSTASPQQITEQKEAEFEAKLKSVKSDIREVKEAAKSIPDAPPKVIYRTRTRTRTMQVKPNEITLYVRHPDGTITEHEVKSDGGFYIIQEAAIVQPKQPEYIIIRDTVIEKKKTIWERIIGK